MIAAIDVHYDEAADTAVAACVVFEHWVATEIVATRVRQHHGLAPYVPGQFYQRELPCLLPLVREVLYRLPVTTIVVDGYVDLGRDRPGLGRHLYDAIGADITVVGVAKSEFRGADSVAIPVRRGDSQSPLWVTSTADTEEAAQGVRRMSGASRIPTLLREVDRLAREGVADSQAG